jgi:small acid-soluble spore protein D (minor alpha/beta-type SASP)
MTRREKQELLKQLKMEAAQEIGHLQYVKENNDHYLGDVPARVNGSQGGPIGGRMVQKMIQAMENRLTEL